MSFYPYIFFLKIHPTVNHDLMRVQLDLVLDPGMTSVRGAELIKGGLHRGGTGTCSFLIG